MPSGTPPLVLVTEPLDDDPLAWLTDRAHVLRVSPEDPGFAEAMAMADGLIVRTYTIVDEAMLETAPGLRVVGRAGTGLDNIDLDACSRRGIDVVNVADANRQAVVEYVISILAMSLRPLPRSVPGGHDANSWAWLRRAAIAPVQMNELVIGILGLGHIGRRVAEVASAIGFTVRYNDLEEIPENNRSGAEAVSLDDLLAGSDVLTVHVDGRAGNRHFLNADHLDRLPENVLLINTSRGLVIDTDALAATMHARPSMRAVLDVHEVEPIPSDCPLLRCPGAVLLPHAASRTRAAQEAMSWVVRDVARVLGLDDGKVSRD